MCTDGVIRLRPWTHADAQWYAECSSDPEIQRWTSDPPGLTAQVVAAAIDAIGADDDAFLIASHDGAQRLGNIAVRYEDGVASVSYWVAVDARGRGVATRALLLLLYRLRDGSRATVATLWTHVDNTASRRTAEQAGFVRDPDGDQVREIKGAQWPTVAYRCALARA